MHGGDLQELISPIARVRKLCWGVLAAMAPLYAVMAQVILESQDAVPPSSDADFLRTVIYACSALCFVLTLVLHRWLFSPDRLAAALRGEALESELEAALQPYRNNPEWNQRVESLSEQELRMLMLTAWTTMRYLVVWMLAESIVILGFVLVVLTNDVADMYPTVAACLLAFALTRPDPDLLNPRGLPQGF